MKNIFKKSCILHENTYFMFCNFGPKIVPLKR